MANNIYDRPAWIRWIHVIALLCIVASLGGTAILATADVAGLSLYFAIMCAVSPIFPLIWTLPALSHEMRIVDSIRAGLLKIPEPE